MTWGNSRHIGRFAFTVDPLGARYICTAALLEEFPTLADAVKFSATLAKRSHLRIKFPGKNSDRYEPSLPPCGIGILCSITHDCRVPATVFAADYLQVTRTLFSAHPG